MSNIDNNEGDFDTFTIPSVSNERFYRSPSDTDDILNDPFENKNATRALIDIDRQLQTNRGTIQTNSNYMNQVDNLIMQARRNGIPQNAQYSMQDLITLHNQFNNRIERIRDSNSLLRQRRRIARNSQWVGGYNTDFGIYPL